VLATDLGFAPGGDHRLTVDGHDLRVTITRA
jgi:hypothetical protein